MELLLLLLRAVEHGRSVISLRRQMAVPPCGADTLLIREKYLRKHHSHHLSTWSLAGTSVLAVGAIWVFVGGIAGLGH